MNRRSFLKLLGLGAAAAATGLRAPLESLPAEPAYRAEPKPERVTWTHVIDWGTESTSAVVTAVRRPDGTFAITSVDSSGDTTRYRSDDSFRIHFA